jgi:lysophospholipase L1-like esterase
MMGGDLTSITDNMQRRLVSAALLALFGAGITCSKSESPTSPTPGPSDGPIVYTAIGASDGIGFGSSSPCVPFTDCPDGGGYVQILRRRLRDNFSSRGVEHANRSIPGAVLSKAIEDLARDIGQPISDLASNFIERQAPFVPTNTTHLTIFAGGNDANVIGRAVLAGRGGNDPTAYIDAQIRQWGTDLEELINRIRARAPNARIVALNMINLAGAPYLSSRPTSERSIMQRIAVGISDRVNALTSKNVLVVDLMCDARLYQPSNYYSDGFHPGDGGYAIFAEDTYPALANGTNSQPNTNCPQRRLVP